MAVSLRQRVSTALTGAIQSLIGAQPGQPTTEGDLVNGVFRLGQQTAYAGVAWYYERIVTAVYTNPTGKRCTDAICGAFAKAPLKCYAPGDELRQTPTKSPLQALLDNPVPRGLTSVMAVSQKMAARKRARDLTLAGMSVTLKVRGDSLDGAGRITQLRRLPPQRVTVVGNEHDELVGFIYWDRLGHRVPLLPSWVIYERFSHPERDYQPYPPALAAGLAGETDTRAARFNLDLLQNDGAIPAVVMLEGLTTDKFNEWVASWRASEYPGRTRFMGFTGTPSGGKSVEVVKLGMTNKEMMQDTLREKAQEDIGRALGCPPVVAFIMSHETYANADREMTLFYGSTMVDYWGQSEDEMTVQLGAEFGVDLAYDTSRIPELQEPMDTLVDRTLRLQAAQNLTINESNRRLGLPEVEWGDLPLAPVLPMQPVAAEVPGAADAGTAGSASGEPTPTPPADPPAQAALPTRRRVRASLQVVPLHGRTSEHQRAATRAEVRLRGRLERFFDRQGRAVEKRLLSPGRDRSLAAVLGRPYFDMLRWNQELAEVIAETAEDLSAETGLPVPEGLSALSSTMNDQTAKAFAMALCEATTVEALGPIALSLRDGRARAAMLAKDAISAMMAPMAEAAAR